MDEEKKQVSVGGSGQPTPYVPEYDELAYNYCLLGATDADLAQFFKVSEMTINRWKKKFPGFLASINAGKLRADMVVVKSLYRRAIGYSSQVVVSQAAKVPATKVKNEDSIDEDFLADSNNGFKTIKVTTREVAPDTRAQMFWLKNRQPKLWREKQEINHTTDGEKLQRITIFELPNDGRNN